MSEDSYLLEPKEKKKRTPYEWFMLLLRICFFISAFALVVITVLANMGGNGETWHEGVRGFISDFTGGRPTKLGKLNNMGFFPTVRLDIEDVDILAKPDDVVPLIHLDELRLGMPFLDVATRSPRLREFYVEGLSVIKGVFMPNEFYLDKLFIDHDQVSPQAMFRTNGKIGLQAWSFEAGMEVQKSITGKNMYVLAAKALFAFDFADVHFKGTYNHVSSNHLKIENFELRAGEKIVSGDVVISTTSDKLMKLQGLLNIQNGRTIISPNLVIDKSHKDGAPTKISGEIKSEKIVIDDVIGKESVFGILTRVRELMGYTGELSRLEGAPSYFGKHDLDLHVFLQNVEADTKLYEALSFDVLKEGGRIRISTVTGKDDHKLMPPVMLLENPEGRGTQVIVQDGDLDIGLVRPWLAKIPTEISKKQSTHVHCGIGSFAENAYSDFALDTIDGIIRTKQMLISKDLSLFDLRFIFSDKGHPNIVALNKDQYDFVKASLQKDGKGSPCEAYISLRKSEQEEPALKASEEQ
jgi:hypothetical protein